MWDDGHDKEMARNQLLAIVLMGALMLFWYVYFVPQNVPPVQQEDKQTVPVDTAREDVAPPPTETSEQEPSAMASDTWPHLPPIPEQPDPVADEVDLQSLDLELVFTRIGGRLKRAYVLPGEQGGDGIQIIPESDVPDTERIYPFSLRFPQEGLEDGFDYRRYEVERGENRVTFSLEVPESFRLRKTYRLRPEHHHLLDVEIVLTNLDAEPHVLGEDLKPAYIFNWGPGMVAEGEGRGYKPTVLYWSNGELEVTHTDDLPHGGDVILGRLPESRWIGYRTKYFLSALAPGGETEIGDGWAYGVPNRFRYGMIAPRIVLNEGESHTTRYQAYIGPMHLGSLREAWATLPAALRFFEWPEFMDWFAKLLLRNLNWWHSIIPNYGLAIIFLTVLVRLVVLPLTVKGMKSMKRMQALAPEMERLKEEYKEDQQEFSRQLMKLYKDRGVNPVGGCFPLFVQMPVFIALYRMLWNAYELRGANFLWIADLSQPDGLLPMPFMEGVPLLGQYLTTFNLLPILMVGAMILNMKITPTATVQTDQQKMMMRIFPVFFGVIMYVLPAGLNLYVLTSTLLGILQTKLVSISDIGEPAKVTKKPLSKRKKESFYTRAKARQRERAKSAKKGGKSKGRKHPSRP